MSGDVYTLLYKTNNPFSTKGLSSSQGTLEELEEFITQHRTGCSFYGIYKKVREGYYC